MAATLQQQDLRVRGELTRAIAALGHAPPNADLAARCDCTVEAVEQSLERLHDAHCLLLHPHSHRPWAVHPFALSPGCGPGRRRDLNNPACAATAVSLSPLPTCR